MYLKRLEIQGFKSLADKIDLQFNPGISAIVGPNGSGKSNIADAVRWVLGEQSVKSLRGARMEDVIFSGSDRRKAVGMAEVSMTLDNSTAVFNLDFSEITVTRRVYRSGESEYLINKSPCRLKDIHELFMDTGIGREGYSIIGQGKIEEILSARSEDRRVIIEEAAGIIKYKTRKQQAVKKLNDTELNMVRISDIISELETQVGPLEEQANRAATFLEYRNELTDLEINLLVHQIGEQQEKLGEINRSDEELKRKLIESETSYRNLESGVEEQKLTVSRLDEEISAAQADIYSTGSRIEKNEAEIMVAKERFNSLDEQIGNLLKDISELKDRETNEKARHSGDEESLANLREKIRQEELELEEFEEQLSVTETGLASGQQAIEEQKADIIELLNQMAGVKNSVNTGEIEMQNLRRRLDQLNEQGASVSAELAEALNKAESTAATLERVGAEITRLDDRETSLCAEHDELKRQLARLAEEESAARARLQENSSRLKALTDLQKDYEGYHRGVKEVLLEAKKGEDAGICGVIAEIIRVPGQYETALEVALGSALQYVVTETDTDARRAIEFLKKNKAGRSTFLPLNTIKPGKDNGMRKISGQKGFIGFAAELVEYESRYANIIDYLLGRVVVVENIRDAAEAAKAAGYAMKVVTLDGDIVNPGGSMTGGFYRRGSASLLGRMREIKETRSIVEELARQVQDLEAQTVQAGDAVAVVDGKIAEAREQLQELYLQQNSCLKDVEAVAQEKARLEGTRSLIEEEQQSAAEQLKNIECTVNNLNKRLEELQQQDEAIRQEIGEHQKMVAGQEERRAELAGRVTEKKVSLAGLRQEEVNYAQIMKRVIDTIRDMEAQMLKKEDQVREFRLQQETLTGEMEKYRQEIVELSRSKGVREEELNRLKNEKQALAEEMAGKESRIKGLSREMAQARELIHASDVKKARLEFEVENSLDRMSEDFGMTYEEALLKKTEITNRREVASRIKELRQAITDLGTVNVGAIEEFERVSERYDFLRRQYSDLEQAKESLFKVIGEMDQIMTGKFRAAFTEINENFGEVFNRFFGGGRAELILTNSDDLLESGIEILAQPPGKKPQHLSLLSGGEKALTAISLLFAILKTKPSPFCVLDEIEASLDEANVDRFAAYLKEYAASTQFVVITHRKRTMESADILYGVTMDDSSVSKLVSMKLSEDTGKVDKVS